MSGHPFPPPYWGGSPPGGCYYSPGQQQQWFVPPMGLPGMPPQSAPGHNMHPGYALSSPPPFPPWNCGYCSFGNPPGKKNCVNCQAMNNTRGKSASGQTKSQQQLPPLPPLPPPPPPPPPVANEQKKTIQGRAQETNPPQAQGQAQPPTIPPTIPSTTPTPTPPNTCQQTAHQPSNPYHPKATPPHPYSNSNSTTTNDSNLNAMPPNARLQPSPFHPMAPLPTNTPHSTQHPVLHANVSQAAFHVPPPPMHASTMQYPPTPTAGRGLRGATGSSLATPRGGRWNNHRGGGRGGGFNPLVPPPVIGGDEGGGGSCNPNFEKLGSRGGFRGRGGTSRGGAASSNRGGPSKAVPSVYGNLEGSEYFGQRHSEPVAATSSAPPTQPEVTPTPPKNYVLTNAEVCNKEDELLKQEEKFDKVFLTWEQNFEKWKTDNANNPDREYVEQQRQKMEEMRNQMLQRRNNIRSQRFRLVEMKRKWSEDTSTNPEFKDKKEQGEPEVKKPSSVTPDVKLDDDDMDIESESGAPQDESEESSHPAYDKDSSVPWVGNKAGGGGGGSEAIPGLGDGKDSEIEKESSSNLMDLSTKDLENISKAVLSLTSGSTDKSVKDEGKKTLAPKDIPSPVSNLPNKDTKEITRTSKSGILEWNNQSKPPSRWNNDSKMASNSSTSSNPSPIFSRRETLSHNEPPPIWGNFKGKQPINPWISGNNSNTSTHHSEEGNNSRVQGNYDGFYGNNKSHTTDKGFARDNSPRFGNSLGFPSSSNVEVIDYGHRQKPVQPEPPPVTFKSYSSPHVFNTHPPLVGLGRDQDKPLEFKKTTGPMFFMSNTSFQDTAGPKEISIEIDELIQPPGRYTRPPKIMIIFRGLPGSGKTHTVKAIKTLEAELGSETPRILSLDDYFEVDGKYEYDASLEDTYRQSLLKSLKKQIDDGYFNFIMVESINSKTMHYKAMADYGLGNGFEVYIAELEAGLSVCAERNVHGRTLKDIEALIEDWEDTPLEYKRIDLKSLDEPRSESGEDNNNPDEGLDKKGDVKEKESSSYIAKKKEVAPNRKSKEVGACSNTSDAEVT